MTTLAEAETALWHPGSLSVPQSEEELTGKGFTPYYAEPINGQPDGKDLLSALQLSKDDIYDYIDGAYRLQEVVDDPKQRGLPLLRYVTAKAIMRQPSTRTGGSMTTAGGKAGAQHELISGMHSSSEAKGESLADSWVAFATQADILGIRTAENGGPAFAAYVIGKMVEHGKLHRKVPVINLGDGQNEHITQALGDMFTIHRRKGGFEGLVYATVCDHERYRADHSDIILAAKLGMTVVAVESPVAPVPQNLAYILGRSLERTSDLDEAMRAADVLSIGRNPDEYKGRGRAEKLRSKRLAADCASWIINLDRLQQMKPDAIAMHPRPRRNELHPSVDPDARMADVEQMANMVPMRMAIIARHKGVNVAEAIKRQHKQDRAMDWLMEIYEKYGGSTQQIPDQLQV